MVLSTQSVIRQSNQGTNEVVTSTPGLLSNEEYVDFWADAVDGLVRVGMGHEIGSEILMQWQDPEHHEAMYVGLMTGWGSTGMVNLIS